jgi:hypothetical protein
VTSPVRVIIAKAISDKQLPGEIAGFSVSYGNPSISLGSQFLRVDLPATFKSEAINAEVDVVAVAAPSIAYDAVLVSFAIETFGVRAVREQSWWSLQTTSAIAAIVNNVLRDYLNVANGALNAHLNPKRYDTRGGDLSTRSRQGNKRTGENADLRQRDSNSEGLTL